jgi:glutamine amidotransferase
MGWNTIDLEVKSTLFHNINHDLGFYFVHSYFFETAYPKNILASTYYGMNFASAVYSENIVGVQFHPEKSHSNGINLLTNFSK